MYPKPMFLKLEARILAEIINACPPIMAGFKELPRKSEGKAKTEKSTHQDPRGKSNSADILTLLELGDEDFEGSEE